MKYIYRLISPNNKSYVGQTKNLSNRLLAYKRLDCKDQKKLYRALNKYKWKNFTHEILEMIPDELANDYEIYYIKKYNCIKEGLNIRAGGEMTDGKNNPMYGRKHSKKTKEKMKNRAIGRKASNETIEKLKNRIPWNKGKKGVQIPWNKGKAGTYHFSEEGKKACSVAQIKRFKNATERIKISVATKKALDIKRKVID